MQVNVASEMHMRVLNSSGVNLISKADSQEIKYRFQWSAKLSVSADGQQTSGTTPVSEKLPPLQGVTSFSAVERKIDSKRHGSYQVSS